LNIALARIAATAPATAAAAQPVERRVVVETAPRYVPQSVRLQSER
jgi:hypothetical protein